MNTTWKNRSNWRRINEVSWNRGCRIQLIDSQRGFVINSRGAYPLKCNTSICRNARLEDWQSHGWYCWKILPGFFLCRSDNALTFCNWDYLFLWIQRAYACWIDRDLKSCSRGRSDWKALRRFTRNHRAELRDRNILWQFCYIGYCDVSWDV